MMDERTQRVLKGIIDSYIKTSEPVGSRTLSKALDLDLSPATIRNIMADLSERGYVVQLHTSGGRIPTDKAYRLYVNSLVTANELPNHIQQQLVRLAEQGSDRIEEVLVRTTRTLADLTQFICVVTSPRAEVSLLQRIEFIKMSSRKILVILVTKAGVVKNKIIESTDDISQEFLNNIAQFLNDQFHNASMVEVRNRILESMVEDKERYDNLLAQAVRLGKKAFDIDDPPDVFIEGGMDLLLRTTTEKQTHIKSLLEAVEKKGMVMELLDQSILQKGVEIFIGMENQAEVLKQCSLITTPYRDQNNVLGMIGVIGPTCMDYQRIIPVVDYTAKILSQAMTDHYIED